MDELYTIILDYGGGTYVSQIFCRNPQKAFDVWINKIDLEKIGITATPGEISDIDEDLAPLENIKNVWCTTFLRSTPIQISQTLFVNSRYVTLAIGADMT